MGSLKPAIVLAGATGDLGGRIAKALVLRGANVRALVRYGASLARRAELERLGVVVIEVDFDDATALSAACKGAACVVSALSGLRPVIVDAQTQLLEAAVKAGVPRFIPSDYAADFTRLPEGENRNFDLRREFGRTLGAAPIAATSILNGAFTDMLTGQAPIVLFKLRRVLYWENADQRLDFTSKDDVAGFTAYAALDADAPRTLRIAGDQITARQLAALMTELTGTEFELLRAGSLKRLERLIAFARRFFPQEGEVFPVWQGMQYLRDMFGGRAELFDLANDRYGITTWARARDVLGSVVPEKACRA